MKERGIRPSGETVVRILAVLAAGMGVVNVITAILPGFSTRVSFLDRYFPITVRLGSHLTVALAGFALLFLSAGLWRRKRVAWAATEVLLGISIVSHLLRGLDFEVTILAAILASGLWALRPYFHARSDPPSIRQGIRMLIYSLLFTLGYGTWGFYLLDRHYKHRFSLEEAVRQTVVMFTQFYDPGLEPLTRFGRYFADSIYFVGVATLGYSAWLLARPVLVRNSASDAERERARRIIEIHARSPLAAIALLPDKSYYFSPGGSVVAFAVKGRTAAALGDPIGPQEDLDEVIGGFVRECRVNDWQPAFYQTRPDTRPHYLDAGFDTLCIGHEGILLLQEFSLEGRENKGLRSTFNHLTRLGYRTEVIQPPIPEGILDILQSISDEWLTTMHGSEMRYSLGWFDRDYLRMGPLIVVHSPEARICAFANLIPEPEANELALDLMRRRQDAEHGIMDFLFVSVIFWARENGYATFNLGLSSLSGVGEGPGDPVVERAMHYVYENVGQFYNFKGLHQFKQKYRPHWSPRYFVYSGPANLASSWLAVVRLTAAEGLAREALRGLAQRFRSPGPPPSQAAELRPATEPDPRSVSHKN